VLWLWRDNGLLTRRSRRWPAVSIRYAVLFLVLAAVALLIAVRIDFWLVRLLAAWWVLDFGLLSAAYGGFGPRLLFKQRNGRRPKWAAFLYAPYFLLNELTFLVYRLTMRQPAYVQIVPNLFLGRRLTSWEARCLRVLRWRAILDLAAEFEEVEYLRRERFYRSLPVLDTMPPRSEELSAGVDWLTKRVAEGPVLVHCALGHGRSATVVVAYLVATGAALTVAEGMALVRCKRPGARPNSRQLLALEDYAQSLA
jgi:hypothetical protein